MEFHQTKIREILKIFLFFKYVQFPVAMFIFLRSHVIVMKGLKNYLGKFWVMFGVGNEGNQGKVDNFQIFLWKKIHFSKERERGSI